MKLSNSELNIMDVLWENGPLSAGDIARILSTKIGWNRNTTYTVIKKAIAKNAVKRSDPNFLCTPLVTREEVADERTQELVENMYDGSYDRFLAAIAKKENLTAKHVKNLLAFIEENK